ncbi:aldehyde dehydrogenase family protein [Pseudonocardia sp. NPDC046786]|uniref:aldehyde dehydrogenase family protein n=1 Tax=Pseudonocardia sp. NPDC046786 TaxID=3155471 RepID=UPI0033C3854E
MQLGEVSRERFNPARPDELVSVTPAGDAATAADAVVSATAAQRAWAARTGPERGAVLMRAGEILASRADLVATDLVREEGKTLAEATGEVHRAANVLRFFGSACWQADGETLPSSAPGTHVYTRREPLGVVGVITPWNFPLAIPTWKIAPALAVGNAVVVKPAQLTPLSVWHLADCLSAAGLPSGVLNVVFGSGSVVGEAIVADPDVSAVSFTGSSAVGARIAAVAAQRNCRVQLEMGGKNPLVVLDDADPAVAADIASAGAFGLTGQACTATSRVIVTPGVRHALTENLVRAAARFQPGDGLNPATTMGPVVSAGQLTTHREFLSTALAEGNQLVCGYEEPVGLFEHAMVVTGVGRKNTLAQEEVFGPLLAVMTVEDLDEAIAVANDVAYGLSAGIVTNDLRAAQHFVGHAEAGVVKVNRPTTGLDLNVPFGGIKASSSNTYREQGLGALDFYSWTKSVYLGV